MRDLVLAVVGMAAVVVVTVKLLDLTDALSAAVLQSADGHAVRFLSGFGAAAADATGGFALVLIGLVVAVGALLVWIELMVRSALVYLLVALSPLAFAAMTWPAARGVLRRTVELLLAVIVSKFVICVAVAVGAAALGGAGSAAGPEAGAAASLGTLLAGAAVLGLAAFSPFVVLRLIPFAEAAVAAHGVSRAPLRGAQAGAMALYSGQSLVRLAGAGGSTVGGAAHLPGGPSSPLSSGNGHLAGPGNGSSGPDSARGSAAPTGASRASAAAAQGLAGGAPGQRSNRVHGDSGSSTPAGSGMAGPGSPGDFGSRGSSGLAGPRGADRPGGEDTGRRRS